VIKRGAPRPPTAQIAPPRSCIAGASGIWRYLRRHHLALLALFVALGGTSYAASQLPANSVGTRQIVNRAVTLHKIDLAAQRALRGMVIFANRRLSLAPAS
jgi:hypothetical protein